MSWCEDNIKNAHFVQLTEQRYINKSVDDVCRWMKRVASIVAKFELIKDTRPDFYDQVYKDGMNKVRLMTQHRQFWDEIQITDVEQQNFAV